MSDTEDQEIVTLQSSDDKKVELTRKEALMSITLRNLLESIDESVEEGTAIPVQVKGEVLKKIVEYMKYHTEHPLPEIDENDFSVTNIEKWDLTFMEVETGVIFEIILAANFLDIRHLLDLGCKTVAKMMIGKTPEEIERIFRIPDK